MKWNVVGVGLLCLVFIGLSFPSGAVPVAAQAQAVSSPWLDERSEATAPPAPITPAPSETELPSPTPSPQPAATPEPDPEPLVLPLPEETPWDTAVISTTILSDDPLDNDTYYDLDPSALEESFSGLSLPADGYQILIIHTHATEAYTPAGTDVYESTDEYRTTDLDQSVVRVGEELAQALESYGLHVLHDTGLYDYPSYNGSYARSGTAIEEYLAAYPSITLVIDLHRDALGSGDTIYKTVTDSGGIQAAQMMFVMGTDVNLEHPRWRENLALAVTLQDLVNQQFDALMRSTVVCDYRYNQQLSPGSLLLEVGTAGNTLAEAITAVQLFAQAVGPWLADQVA
jgi:stage II sporulation protein P